MTERMDNKRIAEALSGCRQKREDNTHWDEQDRGNLSSPLNVLETEHALHDLQDVRVENERLHGLLNEAAWCWCSTLLKESLSGECGGCKIMKELKMFPFHLDDVQAALEDAE